MVTVVPWQVSQEHSTLISVVLPSPILYSHLPSISPLLWILQWLPVMGCALQTGQWTLPVVLIPMGSPQPIHPFALSHGILLFTFSVHSLAPGSFPNLSLYLECTFLSFPTWWTPNHPSRPRQASPNARSFYCSILLVPELTALSFTFPRHCVPCLS